MVLWNELLRQTVHEEVRGPRSEVSIFQNKVPALSFSPFKSIVANNPTSMSLTLNQFSSPVDLMTPFHYEPKGPLQSDIF